MRDVVPVPGRDLAMLVHDDARTVLGLLDMDDRVDVAAARRRQARLVRLLAERLAPDRRDRRTCRASASSRSTTCTRRTSGSTIRRRACCRRRTARSSSTTAIRSATRRSSRRPTATPRRRARAHRLPHHQPPRPGALTCAPSCCSPRLLGLTATAHAGHNELSIGSTIRALRSRLRERRHRRQPHAAAPLGYAHAARPRPPRPRRCGRPAALAVGRRRGTLFQTLTTDVSHDSASRRWPRALPRFIPHVAATAHLDLGAARTSLALRDDDGHTASRRRLGRDRAAARSALELFAVRSQASRSGCGSSSATSSRPRSTLAANRQHPERRHAAAYR